MIIHIQKLVLTSFKTGLTPGVMKSSFTGYIELHHAYSDSKTGFNQFQDRIDPWFNVFQFSLDLLSYIMQIYHVHRNSGIIHDDSKNYNVCRILTVSYTHLTLPTTPYV